jgi:hypothetical protein
MIQVNKTKARKMFWLALLLFITSQMFQVFANPSQDFVSDLTASLASGIGLFPLGIFYPIKRLVDFTSLNRVTGDTFYNLASIFSSFLAASVLLYGARVYAQGKGQHEATGYLGLFGFVGIAILLMMPDKSKASRFQ